MPSKTKTKGKASAKPAKTKARGVLNALTAKRETANKTNAKRRVKRHYTDNGAQYLAQAVAMVLTKRPAKGIPAREWAITNPTECVIVDARKVVRNPEPAKLVKRPENTLRARLASMATYAPQAGGVGYSRYLINGSPAITETNPEAFWVVLHRK